MSAQKWLDATNGAIAKIQARVSSRDGFSCVEARADEAAYLLMADLDPNVAAVLVLMDTASFRAQKRNYELALAAFNA